MARFSSKSYTTAKQFFGVMWDGQWNNFGKIT